MESSKENIEAQLCAYIEGELSDVERAQIERHLDANPRHRALIADLMRHRMDLASLPRAKAPAELNEALCGQLERSALLDPAADDDTEVVLRINRWPQYAAVAAVVLLAVGLGIVVYSVLPGPGGRPSIAINDTALKNVDPERALAYKEYRTEAEKKYATELAQQVELLNKSALADESRKELTPGPGSADKLANASHEKGASSLWADSKAKTADAGGALARSKGDVTAREVEDLRRKLDLRAQGISNTYVMYVSAEDLSAANQQVAALLKSNGITYREEPAPLVAQNTLAMNQPAEDFDARSRRANKFERSDAVTTTAPPGSRGAGAGAGGAGAALPTVSGKHVAGEFDAADPQGQGAAGRTMAAKPSAAADAMRSGQKAPTAPQANATRVAKDDAYDQKPQPQKEAEMAKKGSAESYGITPTDRRDKSGTDGSTMEKQLGEGSTLGTTTLGLRQMPAQTAGQTASVIVATMNRRQANQLAEALSQGHQRAELRLAAPIVAGKDQLTEQSERFGAVATGRPMEAASRPTTAPAASASNTFYAATLPAPEARSGLAATTQPATAGLISRLNGEESFGKAHKQLADQPTAPAVLTPAPLADGLHLRTDPLDEPIEVMIVVQSPLPADSVTPPVNPSPANDAAEKKDARPQDR